MLESRWKSPRDHERRRRKRGKAAVDEKKARASRTFRGISERFLESRGCIKIFNTFIQFANEVSRGGEGLLSRAMIKKNERRDYIHRVWWDDVSRGGENLKRAVLFKKKLLIVCMLWFEYLVIRSEKLKMGKFMKYFLWLIIFLNKLLQIREFFLVNVQKFVV